MNKVELLGRLTKEAELRSTKVGTSVTTFVLAVNKVYSAANSDDTADFFSVVAWGRLAEFITKHIKKGQQLVVVGRLQTRNYEDAKGIKRYVTEVVAEEVYLTGNKPKEQKENIFENATVVENFDDSDILPF